MKLGVFDSGIGGEAVALALQKTFPAAAIITVNDTPNVPYGSKSPETVRELTDVAIGPLLAQHCDVIILACNTATAHAIEFLREKYPQQKFIGIEPMIKTAAAATNTGMIAVCATPATLASERYKTLLAAHGQHLTVIEPDCHDWAYRIEHNTLNEAHITEVIAPLLARDVDVIVLGCTHYHWIKEVIVRLANGQAAVLEPSEAIGRRVKALLKLR